ncbi:hypothetical protein DW191_09490 [Parabacteroides merdae]|uniref:Uncharacterized protein n=1 Tax=Parabacteroides merdae TaxID=46503 RepID=A0A414XV58_9BACT|nr:hypothetical protein DW191_09490 [Parabacteroides merdae]
MTIYKNITVFIKSRRKYKWNIILFLPAFIIIWDKVRKNSIEIGTDGSNLYYKCSLKNKR